MDELASNKMIGSDATDHPYRSQSALDSRQLLTFRAVASELSFTRAAGKLGYVQSSVTAHVQALEREFGVPLFERLGRTVKLTDAGVRLLGYADRLLALTEEARRAVAGDADATGTLMISAPDTLCAYRLPAVVHAFRRDYPSVRVVFQPMRSSKQALRAVADGSIDIALLLDEPVDAKGFVTDILAPEPLCVLVAPDHPLAGVKTIDAGRLSHMPTVLTEQGCGYRDLFERVLNEAGVSRGSSMEFASIEAIKECVKAGMGLTVLPRVAVSTELSAHELVALPWDGPPLEIVTQIVWHKDKWLSPTLNAFLNHARSRIGEATTHGDREETFRI